MNATLQVDFDAVDTAAQGNPLAGQGRRIDRLREPIHAHCVAV